jgi:hypothetical protein
LIGNNSQACGGFIQCEALPRFLPGDCQQLLLSFDFAQRIPLGCIVNSVVVVYIGGGTGTLPRNIALQSRGAAIVVIHTDSLLNIESFSTTDLNVSDSFLLDPSFRLVVSGGRLQIASSRVEIRCISIDVNFTLPTTTIPTTTTNSISTITATTSSITSITSSITSTITSITSTNNTTTGQSITTGSTMHDAMTDTIASAINAQLIGGIFGGIVALILIGAVIACIVARNRRKLPHQDDNSMVPAHVSSSNYGPISQSSVYDNSFLKHSPSTNYDDGAVLHNIYGTSKPTTNYDDPSILRS